MRKRSPSEERTSDQKRRERRKSSSDEEGEAAAASGSTAAPSHGLLDSPEEQHRQRLGDVSGETEQPYNPDDFLSEEFTRGFQQQSESRAVAGSGSQAGTSRGLLDSPEPQYGHGLGEVSGQVSQQYNPDDFLSQDFLEGNVQKGELPESVEQPAQQSAPYLGHGLLFSSPSDASLLQDQPMDLSLLGAQQQAEDSSLFFSERLEEILENRGPVAHWATGLSVPSHRIPGVGSDDIYFLSNRRPIGYKILETLGQGAFAAVVRAEVIPHGGFLAIKVYRAGQLHANVEGVLSEVRIIRRLRDRPHRNVLKFFAFFKHPTNSVYYLVSDYTELKDLYESLQVRNRLGQRIWLFLDEGLVHHLSRGIGEGLNHLHANGIAHCDLKLENVLVFWKSDTTNAQMKTNISTDKRLIYQWEPKLADFNNSLMRDNPVGVGGNFMTHGPRCTITYAAPESWTSTTGVITHYDAFKADAYSLGCCVLSLALSSRQFDPINLFRTQWPAHNDPQHAQKQIKFIKQCQRLKLSTSFVEHLCRHLSSQMKRVVLKLLDPNPQTRLTVNQFVSDEWITRRQSYETDAYKPRRGLPKKIMYHEYH